MRSIFDLLNDFKKKEAAIKHLTEQLPTIIGVECVKEIKRGFNGSNPHGWAERKAVTNKAYDYNRTKKFRTKTGKKSKAVNQYKGSVYQSDRPILVQTGNLRDSIMYEVTGKTVHVGVLNNSPKKAKAPADSHTYAKKMNEGGVGKWGKYATTHTVARPFMPKPGEPPTKTMIEKINKKIDFEVKKFMNGWEK
jgi:hypothetical protein